MQSIVVYDTNILLSGIGWGSIAALNWHDRGKLKD